MDRPAHDRRVPSLARGEPHRGPGAGLGPRHESRQRRSKRVPRDRGPLRRRRPDQPGRPGIQALPADSRPDADKPQHLGPVRAGDPGDRKSTRLNSSHRTISYAVFCLKKKKKNPKSYNIKKKKKKKIQKKK